MYRDPVQSLEALLEQPPAAAMRPLRVGMIGIGTVGAGTFRVLARNQAEIAGRAGRGIKMVVVCARSLARAMGVVGKEVALTNDPMQVATHPEVDVLVEAAGGTGPARDWVLAAIRAGKHVVTANKALLAEHGNEIFAAARQHGVAVAYEGAVAVSIPIVKALREGLTANRIEWVAGIINGTTNFILSKMREEGVGFAEALAAVYLAAAIVCVMDQPAGYRVAGSLTGPFTVSEAAGRIDALKRRVAASPEAPGPLWDLASEHYHQGQVGEAFDLACGERQHVDVGLAVGRDRTALGHAQRRVRIEERDLRFRAIGLGARHVCHHATLRRDAGDRIGLAVIPACGITLATSSGAHATNTEG